MTTLTLDTEWDECELSVRASNGLRNGGYKTIRDIGAVSDKDLRSMGNFGSKSIREVREIYEIAEANTPLPSPNVVVLDDAKGGLTFVLVDGPDMTAFNCGRIQPIDGLIKALTDLRGQ